MEHSYIVPETLPRAADFFRGKDVFITGASGFLGNVLIEKLLRVAPEVGTIFMLLRPKRGKTPQERIAHIIQCQVYDLVRAQQPNALSKLHAVEGDVSLLGLGLSPEDTALLQERVSVVIHAAATVRFDEPYRKAVFENVRGTREVCELARGMPRLQALVHVSTAYSNADLLENEERLYPAAGDWRAFIKAAENFDTRTVDILTDKILGAKPNTYVLTKSLAEHVIHEYGKELPVSIIRPSIVGNSAFEPFPGWTDNYNGPFGFSVLGAIGFLHFYYRSKYFDIVPVDVAIRAIILAALKKGVVGKTPVVPIYNNSAHDAKLFKIKILEESAALCPKTVMRRFSMPWVGLIESNFAFVSLYLILTVIPCIIGDIITKKKMGLMKLSRTVYVATQKTWFFQIHYFHLPNDQCMALNDEIHPDDKGILKISFDKINRFFYVITATSHFVKYFLNKDLKDAYPWQDFLLVVGHFIACGILLLAIWKLHIIYYVLRLAIQTTRILLVV